MFCTHRTKKKEKASMRMIERMAAVVVIIVN